MPTFKRHKATGPGHEGCLTIEVPHIVLSQEWDGKDPSVPRYTQEAAEACQEAMIAYAERMLKKGQLYQLCITIPSDWGRTCKMRLLIGFFATGVEAFTSEDCLGIWQPDVAAGVIRKFLRVQS